MWEQIQIRDQTLIRVAETQMVTVINVMANLPEKLMISPMWMIRAIILNGATVLIV
jgi:hypothetical protein